MRGLVAYDSYFGNAGRVAAAIAEELRAAGHHARVIDLHHERVTGSALATESDFLVLGGPTRMKHMSRRARSFAKKIDAAVWAGDRHSSTTPMAPLTPTRPRTRATSGSIQEGPSSCGHCGKPRPSRCSWGAALSGRRPRVPSWRVHSTTRELSRAASPHAPVEHRLTRASLPANTSAALGTVASSCSAGTGVCVRIEGCRYDDVPAPLEMTVGLTPPDAHAPEPS